MCVELTTVLVSLGPLIRSTAKVKSKFEKDFLRGRTIFFSKKIPKIFGSIIKSFISLHRILNI
tara:strand:- start:306 stop:494 length:189 start_codon:yes stop_codon:yes gene_type:complete